MANSGFVNSAVLHIGTVIPRDGTLEELAGSRAPRTLNGVVDHITNALTSNGHLDTDTLFGKMVEQQLKKDNPFAALDIGQNADRVKKAVSDLINNTLGDNFGASASAGMGDGQDLMSQVMKGRVNAVLNQALTPEDDGSNFSNVDKPLLRKVADSWTRTKPPMVRLVRVHGARNSTKTTTSTKTKPQNFVLRLSRFRNIWTTLTASAAQQPRRAPRSVWATRKTIRRATLRTTMRRMTAAPPHMVVSARHKQSRMNRAVMTLQIRLMHLRLIRSSSSIKYCSSLNNCWVPPPARKTPSSVATTITTTLKALKCSTRTRRLLRRRRRKAFYP